MYRTKLNTEKEEELTKQILLEHNGIISRYILEGKLLYDLNFTQKKMYHTLMNLTLKEEIELIEKNDGQYYISHTS